MKWGGLQPCTPPDELEASPVGSGSDDYVLAFLWFSAPPSPNFELFWSAAAAAAGLGCLSRRVCAVGPNNIVKVFGRCRPAKPRPCGCVESYNKVPHNTAALSTLQHVPCTKSSVRTLSNTCNDRCMAELSWKMREDSDSGPGGGLQEAGSQASVLASSLSMHNHNTQSPLEFFNYDIGVN